MLQSIYSQLYVFYSGFLSGRLHRQGGSQGGRPVVRRLSEFDALVRAGLHALPAGSLDESCFKLRYKSLPTKRALESVVAPLVGELICTCLVLLWLMVMVGTL